MIRQRLDRFLTRYDLLILIVMVLLTRIAFLALFGQTLSLSTSGYDDYARHLMAGQGYTRFADLHPDSDIPPLYPFVLVAIYTVFGRSALAVAVVQIGFEVVTVICVALIGRRVGGHAVGFVSGLLTALYPYQLFQNLTVNDTAIFMALLCAGVYFGYRTLDAVPDQRSTLAAPILYGLLLGAAALTKTLALLMLPLLTIYWASCWWHTQWRRWVIASLAAGAAAGLVMLPWIVRNYGVHQAFVLVSTNGGSNFYQANNSCAIEYMEAGWDVQWVEAAGCLNKPPAGLSETQTDRWLQAQGMDYLRAHPDQWLRLFGDKLLVLWSPDITPRALPPTLTLPEGDPVNQYQTTLFELARQIHLLYFTPLLILGIIGGGLSLYGRRPVVPVLTVLIAVTLTYLIFHPSTRYRAPADPFVFILAAYALVVIVERIRNSTQDKGALIARHL